MSDDQRPGEYPSRSDGHGGVEDGYPTQDIPGNTGNSAGQGYPQGPPQYDYGHQPPPGYPQQPPPGYPQQPPSGYSQQPPPGYGQQPPPGYGQPPPPGYGQQPSHGFGEPPKRSSRPTIVAIVAVVIALIIGGIVWGLAITPAGTETSTSAPSTPVSETTSDVPTMTPPSDEPADTTAPLETRTLDDGQIIRPTEPPETNGEQTVDGEETVDGEVPTMPSQVGDFQAVTDPEPEFGMYGSSTTEDVFIVFYSDSTSSEDFISDLTDAEMFGTWTCGVEPETGEETPLCVSDAYDGIVAITGSGDAASVTAFGDEFLRLWK